MSEINYKKAFDSVPYSWRLEDLKVYKIIPIYIFYK
jgi:hypothetical protein